MGIFSFYFAFSAMLGRHMLMDLYKEIDNLNVDFGNTSVQIPIHD